MAFGRPSWIAVALVGDDLARQVVKVHSRTVMYPNTSGPFYGMGGSALTDFEITVLRLRSGTLLVFADHRFIGWVDHTPGSDFMERFAQEPLNVKWLQPVETCPVEVPEVTR